MAEFQTAFDATMGNEGGYANDPDDTGGETYQGISRSWYPAWPGWLIIDGFKAVAGQPNPYFLKIVSNHQSLKTLAQDFYKGEYWDPLRCGEIESQSIASEIFDTAINMGRSWAVGFLQRGLNALNKNEAIYGDIDLDKQIGPETLRALKECLSHNSEILLLKIMNGLQLTRYIEIMTDDPTQERFARGWIEHRINIGKI